MASYELEFKLQILLFVLGVLVLAGGIVESRRRRRRVTRSTAVSRA